MTSRSQPRKIIVIPAAPRVDEARGRDFVDRVNKGLITKPLFKPEDTHVVANLLEQYYSSLTPEEDIRFRIGRVAAYYLQNQKAPLPDRRPKEIQPTDAVMAVTRTIARIINERRKANDEALKPGVQ